MNKLLIALTLFASPAFAQDGATDPNMGVVVGKMPGATSTSYINFFNYPTVASPVLATTEYALPSFGKTLTNPLSLSGIKGPNKVWLSKYSSGTGHKDAPNDLTADSQFMIVGGREYGAGTYKGIGFGYVSSTADIAPVFAGSFEQRSDGNTTADLVFATRSTVTNAAPVVRLSVTSLGQLTAGAGYAPATDLDLATKKYVDDAIASALKKAAE